MLYRYKTICYNKSKLNTERLINVPKNISKMFIVFLVIISMLLSLTACGNKSEPTVSDEYGCLTVLGSSWGMSLDECLKVLKLKKEDVKIKAEDGFSSFEIDKNFLGKQAKVSFLFYDEVKEKIIPIGLNQVDIWFEEQLDLEIAKAQIIKDHKVKNIEFEEIYKPVTLQDDKFALSYENKNKVGSIDDGLTVQYNEFLIKLGSKDIDSTMKFRQNRALSSVSVVFDKSKKVYSIRYEGFEAAMINQASKLK